MRRLIILRHAKADPHHRGDSRDHARGLVGRGIEDAQRMGTYLAQEGIRIDSALVSDAARASETFELAAKAYGQPVPVRFEPHMYGASPYGLLELVHGVDKAVGSLLLVGHNPELAELAVALCSGRNVKGLSDLRGKFPTAALAIIDFDAADWFQIAGGTGTLERFVTPGLLAGTADD